MTFTTDAGVFSKKAIDFGSQVLLNAVHFPENSTLLDVGCGYGPMGLSLAKVQGVTATLIDVNLRALALAEKNAIKNGVTADIFQSNLYTNISGLLIISSLIHRFVLEKMLCMVSFQALTNICVNREH
jgi:16S rRNA (guanine1207-N2)-methyltransferase